MNGKEVAYFCSWWTNLGSWFFLIALRVLDNKVTLIVWWPNLMRSSTNLSLFIIYIYIILFKAQTYTFFVYLKKLSTILVQVAYTRNHHFPHTHFYFIHTLLICSRHIDCIKDDQMTEINKEAHPFTKMTRYVYINIGLTIFYTLQI